MIAIQFTKDEQIIWEKETPNGVVHSAAIDVNDEVFNMETGFVTEERMIFWVKGNNQAIVTKTVDTLIKQVNSGKLATYRSFSDNPFYANQPKDVNPTTGVEMDRYSTVKLCPADQRDVLHRKFVVNAPINAEVATGAAPFQA